MLFLTEGFTISGLRRHLGFSYVGPWQHICIPGLQLWTKHVYDTKTYVFLMDVAHFWGTFLHHTFPSIFVIYSSAILHIDIKKPCQQHIQVRCPWKYESNHWKCLLLLIGRFRIGHTTFRWFPKMYFRFPHHHVNNSGRDVIELHSIWRKQLSESLTMSQKRMTASLTILEIQRQKWTGGILPPVAGIRVKMQCYATNKRTNVSCSLPWLA